MAIAYRLMYRVGLAPWDGGRVPAELVELAAAPAGRSLDLGCGTGRQSVYLAERGWQATAVHLVERPLAAGPPPGAPRRGGRGGGGGGRGDGSRLDARGRAPGFDLLYDAGCFHGLPAAGRDGYVRGVTELAAPGARLLLMAFGPGFRGAAPRGAGARELRD